MPKSFSGGCACGAIRYECLAEPDIWMASAQPWEPTDPRLPKIPKDLPPRG